VTADLFDDAQEDAGLQLAADMATGAVLLRGFARDIDVALLQGLESIKAAAPLRHLVTPGGYTMSVAMSNCGSLGWVSDRGGYSYREKDPLSGRPWPAIPAVWRDLAVPDTQALRPTPASSTSTSPAQNSRCIRTGMNPT
jgi:DNA oxidative demethylase